MNYKKSVNTEVSTKMIATRGAVWVAISSIIGAILAYYRNWILCQFGSDGKVVGSFALVLLFVELITTFIMFGGSSVVINFLSKIQEKSEKSSFIISYISLSIPTGIVFGTVIEIWPNTVSLISGQNVDPTIIRYLIYLIPVVVLSNIIIYSLSGLMKFRLLAFCLQLQLLFVCIFSTYSFFFYPEVLTNSPLLFLTIVVGLAYLLVILMGGLSVIKTLEKPKKVFFYPKTFWRYALFVQGNTLITFAELSIDKIFILSSLGVEELGAYFILIQCAELIRFIPVRVGQVFLATFSKLIAEGKNSDLENSYNKLTKIIVVMSGMCAITLILFSNPIAQFFGDWAGERYHLLIVLSAIYNIGCITNINCMLIMAKERTGIFLSSNVVMISAQLAITIFLINDYGVYGVIAGKAAGTIIGQIGLFIILAKWLPGIIIRPPNEYWLSQIIVILTAVFVFHFDKMSMVNSFYTLLGLLPIYCLIVRFDPRDLIRMLLRDKRFLQNN